MNFRENLITRFYIVVLFVENCQFCNKIQSSFELNTQNSKKLYTGSGKQGAKFRRIFKLPEQMASFIINYQVPLNFSR